MSLVKQHGNDLDAKIRAEQNKPDIFYTYNQYLVRMPNLAAITPAISPKQLTFDEFLQQNNKDFSVKRILDAPDGKRYNKYHDTAVNFYNNTFMDILCGDRSGKIKVIDLKAAFKQAGLRRVSRVQRAEQQKVSNTSNLLYRVLKDHEMQCDDAFLNRQTFSLSQWPPRKPFMLLAAQMGSAGIVSELLLHNACDIFARDSDKNTALHLAAYYGHDKVVNLILREAKKKNNFPLQKLLQSNNSQNETPLQSAITGQTKYEKEPQTFWPVKRRAVPFRPETDTKRSRAAQDAEYFKFVGEWTHMASTRQNWILIKAEIENAMADQT